MRRDGLSEDLPANRGIVLIHGAMHGGWCWDRLRPHLQHQSLAIDLPGRGPTAFFSILDAHTHIPAHSGVTNTRLTVHLPLIVPPKCRFRVGGETREWRAGTAWVFDDTIEHEAWNDSDSERIVFIIDVWNPNLTSAERDHVRTITSGIGEYYGPGTTMRET